VGAPVRNRISRSPADVDRAYVATVAAMEGYAAQLEQLLGAQR
jgi:hypothetical protein